MTNFASKFDGKGIHVIATGSVDGVLTTAAFLRVIGLHEEKAGVEFTQAFTVDKLNPAQWPEGRQVVFVDLAVNNQNPEMTADFVRRIREAGHEIVAVCDEHDADAWKRVLGQEPFEALIVKPQSQKKGEAQSSGAILLEALGDEADDHTRELCEAANAADQMDFSTHFGSYANRAVKSAMGDNSRRVHLAGHFAANREPDEVISSWCAEYEAIIATHEEVLGNREDLGSGIVRIDCTGKKVDMTTLMGQVYDLPETKACLVIGPVYNKAKGGIEVMASFGTRIEGFDIQAAIQSEGVSAGGFASKANVDLENEKAAIEAVRKALNG